MRKTRKKTAIIAALVLVITSLVGCDAAENKPTPGIPDVEIKSENTKEQLELIESLKEDTTGERSGLNGKVMTQEQLSNMPLAFVIENSKSSMPQSGLDRADVVYEMEVEWGVTRFLAIYQSERAAKIGPIRSTRKYIQELVKFNGIPFAHAGGSNESIAIIATDNLKSINEIGLPRYFYRDRSRRAPHNLYTSYDKIEEYSRIKDYVGTATIGSDFREDAMGLTDQTATSISIVPSSYVDISYEYKDGKYERYQDGKGHVDKETKSQLYAETIIVQRVASRAINDAEKHIALDIVGEGRAYIFSDGKVISGTWKKSNLTTGTKFYDSDGRRLFLPPGKLWWHIIREGTDLTYN